MPLPSDTYLVCVIRIIVIQTIKTIIYSKMIKMHLIYFFLKFNGPLYDTNKYKFLILMFLSVCAVPRLRSSDLKTPYFKNQIKLFKIIYELNLESVWKLMSMIIISTCLINPCISYDLRSKVSL